MRTSGAELQFPILQVFQIPCELFFLGWHQDKSLRLKPDPALQHRSAHTFYPLNRDVDMRYDVVLSPKFAVKDIANRNERVFNSKTARSMYNWSHYAFRQRLKSKALAYDGRVIVEIGEPGTSKTCGCCGAWKADLGGNKRYNCSHCGVKMDRDVNGARNNLLAAYGVATGVLWDGTE